MKATLKLPPYIQPATNEDVIHLLPMMKEFGKFASNKYSLYPGDIQAMNTLNFLISTQFVLIAKDGQTGVRLGCFAGIVAPHLFNSQIKVLTELLWWVEPAYRRSSAGLKLLESAIHWAKQNVDMFVMTLEHNSPVNPRTLKKRGFKLRESNYILEV